MEDIHKVGGIPALLKYLLNHTDLIDGSQMTVTGKTLAQNLEQVEELEFERQDVVRKLESPLKNTGHLTILRGNLAPGTAVAKLTGHEGARFDVSLTRRLSSCLPSSCLVHDLGNGEMLRQPRRFLSSFGGRRDQVGNGTNLQVPRTEGSSRHARGTRCTR